MLCRGCGEDKKLIKAHIIPESFFTGLRGGKLAPKIITNTKGIYPKKAPIGVYDTEILCRDCENKFQKIDDYGHRALIKEEHAQEPLYHMGELVGYYTGVIDYEALKLFFISILWRASISNHYFYKRINLGKLENKAKELVWDANAGNRHDYSFVLAKFDEDRSGNCAHRSILDPHTEKYFNIRYCRFYLYGYVLYIKADPRMTPTDWDRFIPGDNRLIIMSRGSIEESKEYPVLVKAAKNGK